MHNTSKEKEDLLQLVQYMSILTTLLLLIVGLALAIDPTTERICLLLALGFTLLERYIALKKYRLLVSRYVNEKENHDEFLL
jgi:hypothetical protein